MFVWQERPNNKNRCSFTMSEPTSDPALAAAKATMPDALSLNALSVIGLMQAHDGATALLRSARGQVVRVHVGDDIFGGSVTAISDDLVVFTDRWGRVQTLQLPSS